MLIRETVTVSEPILIVTELMVNGALNKYLQTPVGQTLAQKVNYLIYKIKGFIPIWVLEEISKFPKKCWFYTGRGV